jgi:hypothetical protein
MRSPALLTAEQVAELLQLAKRTVAKLGIPFVRVGAGKGVRRYRQEDVDTYINLRVQYRGSDGKEAEKKKTGSSSEWTAAGGVTGSPIKGAP